MAVLVYTIALFAIMAIALARGAKSVTRQREAWAEAARWLGLAYVSGSMGRVGEMTGTIDGFGVKVDTVMRGSGKTRRTYTRAQISGRGRIPHSLKLTSEGFLGVFTPLRKVFKGDDVQTFDVPFDTQIRVDGPVVEVAALLDERTRGLIRGVVSTLGAKVVDGDLLVERRGVICEPREIVDLVGSLAQVASGLSPGGRRLSEMLADNAATDSNSAVRKHNLSLLLDHAGDRPEAREAARRALTDEPSIRLAAAAFLGEEGIGTLHQLLVNVRLPDPLRAEALSATARFLAANPESAHRAAILERLEHALQSRDEVVVEAAVEGLGLVRQEKALKALIDMSVHATSRRAACLARCFGAIGAPEAEHALISMLDREDDAVSVAVANALGAIGGIGAVEPLLELTKGIFADGEVKRAASEAVARIQARMGEVEAGRLSIAEADVDEGGLSLAVDGGTLAVAASEVEVED